MNMCRKIYPWLLIVLAMATSSSLVNIWAASPPSAHPMIRSGGVEFLFDDKWIDRKKGVRRVTGVPIKYPGPVLKKDKPWEPLTTDENLGVLYDQQEHKFKMWYKAAAPAVKRRAGARGVEPSEMEATEKLFYICYAESRDGVDWIKPSLGLFNFDGSTDNNIIRGVANRDTFFYNVIKDPDDPNPGRRYKGFGFDTTSKSILRDRPSGGTGISVAYSPDGFHWPEEPTLVMDTSDVTDGHCILPVRDPATGHWVAFIRPRVYPKRRYLGYAESIDFNHWTLPRMLLTPNAEDDEWTEFYGLAAAPVEHWRIGALWVFHNNPIWSPFSNELVYSRDGINYRRAMPRQYFIPPGPEGSFDSVMIIPIAVIERETELFIYYWASNGTHGSDRFTGLAELTPSQTQDRKPRVTGIGLARFAWGQFCGLRADIDGTVETKWLCNYGNGSVKAVAAIAKDGFINAEILDQYGRVIPGWSISESRSRVAEHGKLAFFWNRDVLVGRYGQTSEQGGKIGHVVKLRFQLHKATIYGFEVGEEGAMPEYIE
jgi:hypothetical protein